MGEASALAENVLLQGLEGINPSMREHSVPMAVKIDVIVIQCAVVDIRLVEWGVQESVVLEASTVDSSEGPWVSYMDEATSTSGLEETFGFRGVEIGIVVGVVVGGLPCDWVF